MFNKVQAATSQVDDAGREFLVFTLANQEYGIDILKVQEIRGYDAQSVTRIANVPSFIKGVTNLRGIIVPMLNRIKPGLGDFLEHRGAKLAS